MPSNTARLTIGGLSRSTRVNIETIRYYERIGLLPKASRSAGGFRIYAGDDIARLTFIRRSRSLGFTLGEVRVLLQLAAGPPSPRREIQCLVTAHLQSVRDRIVDLKRMEGALEGMLAGCAKGGGSECPILKALSESPVRSIGRLRMRA